MVALKNMAVQEEGIDDDEVGDNWEDIEEEVCHMINHMTMVYDFYFRT